MKKLITLVIISLIFLYKIAYCETIALKDGRVIEGKIIERTEEYIKIDFQGMPLTFFMEDIKRIGNISYIPFPKKDYPSSTQSQSLSVKGKQDGTQKDSVDTQDLRKSLSEKMPQSKLPDASEISSSDIQKVIDYKKDGINQINWPNGNVMMQLPMKNGKLEGWVKIYDLEGKLTGEIFYLDGKLIEQRVVKP